MARAQIDKIIQAVPEAERINQLAEECCELAHAVLKLARANSKTNPTPKTETEIIDMIAEELADVVVCIDCLPQLDFCNAVIKNYGKKLSRWYERIVSQCE